MPSNNLDSMRLDAFGGIAVVAVADAAALPAAVDAVSRTVVEFDQACSRFRDDSELSAVNRASGMPVRVGPVFLDAVAASLRAARLTGGDVDPTVGEALIALGYDRDFDALSSDRDAASRRDGDAVSRRDGDAVSRRGGDAVSRRGGDAVSRRDGDAAFVRPVARIPGWRTVAVDLERSTVRVAQGVVLDLGATAKALAADRAAALAHSQAGCGVLVSFSGDIAIAGPAPVDGWRVRVTDDHRASVDAPGQWISLRSGGLATSSTSVRQWRTAVGVAHHLVDPSTGRSAESVWRTASVTAASCLDANVASTATIIRGGEAAAWLEGLGLPSRLVHVDGTVRHLAGWPSEDDDLPLLCRSGTAAMAPGEARGS
jgi:FAD:protein FMN transferase